MTINYQLSNSDYLTFQLYTSSKSELHKKRRNLSRILIPVIYVLFGIYLVMFSRVVTSGYVFIGLSIVWYALHPFYSRWRYKNHFKKHVEHNYKNRINKPISIEFDKDFIISKDFTSESKISHSELKELIEIDSHFFIALTSDLALIVPKHVVSDIIAFKKKITDYGADYKDELNWKWK